MDLNIRWAPAGKRLRGVITASGIPGGARVAGFVVLAPLGGDGDEVETMVILPAMRGRGVATATYAKLVAERTRTLASSIRRGPVVERIWAALSATGAVQQAGDRYVAEGRPAEVAP